MTADAVGERYDAALEEVSRYFMGSADVQHAAKRVSAKLDELAIPYAICGGLAVAAHGYLRVTQDVNVLLTTDGLKAFKDRCLGLSWVERFAGSRNVTDAVHGVPIDFVLTGDYPGDGVEKPVRFPDPGDVALPRESGSILSLPSLLELKLASGMTAPERLRDLDDVIQLIKVNGLGPDHGAGLAPYVQAKYRELWELAQIDRGH